jgi:hypothetical protein
MRNTIITIASLILLQVLFLPSCFPPFEPKDQEPKPDTIGIDSLKPHPALTEAELALMPISEQASNGHLISTAIG